MKMKPFRPPQVVGRQPSLDTLSQQVNGGPVAKRRRISSNTANDRIGAFDAAVSSLSKPLQGNPILMPAQRKPLDVVRNSSVPLQDNAGSCEVDSYYTVLWYV